MRNDAMQQTVNTLGTTEDTGETTLTPARPAHIPTSALQERGRYWPRSRVSRIMVPCQPGRGAPQLAAWRPLLTVARRAAFTGSADEPSRERGCCQRPPRRCARSPATLV